jgi:hypothetical protein
MKKIRKTQNKFIYCYLKLHKFLTLQLNQYDKDKIIEICLFNDEISYCSLGFGKTEFPLYYFNNCIKDEDIKDYWSSEKILTFHDSLITFIEFVIKKNNILFKL